MSLVTILFFLRQFKGFGLIVAKWVFKLNFSNAIYNFDKWPSIKDWISNSVYKAQRGCITQLCVLNVAMFLRQTDRYLPTSQEATIPLFSVYVFIG